MKIFRWVRLLKYRITSKNQVSVSGIFFFRQSLKDTIAWLDTWEKEINIEITKLKNARKLALSGVTDATELKQRKNYYKDQIKKWSNRYLSRQTSEGLRVTLYSVAELCQELKSKFNFQFVLTRKMNQDSLEVKILNRFNNEFKNEIIC